MKTNSSKPSTCNLQAFVLFFIFQSSFFISFGQAPEKISYQAVIRDAGNEVVTNQQVGMKISILQGSESGTVVYAETHTPTTNANGLVSVIVGNGTPLSGNITTINWGSGTYFLKSETDAAGGTTYSITIINQILSVPYALHANKAEEATKITGSVSAFLVPPTVSIATPTNVASYSATLNGMVNGEGFLTNVVFEWGTTTSYGQTISATQSPVAGTNDVQVSANISGLQSATNYHYRIKASNPVNISYSEDMSFTTSISVPQLTTNAVTNILAFSATSGGNITYDGGSPITTRGVCWSTSPNPTTSNTHVASGDGIGSFTINMIGLTDNTTYYVRAYATNALGTTYGNEISFTTITFPTVTTVSANDIKGSSAKSGGTIINNGGSAIIAQGLCWSTTPNPSTANNTTTSFSEVMTSLSPNTTYYVRAYATNAAGTGYGNEISFNSGRLIGSTYAGGLVFYNDGAGGGLVCAESDQSTGAQWGCFGTAIGGTSTAVFTGASNTNAIVAGCATAGIAARICYDLVLNTYTDWYLPSRDELSLMYTNLHTQSLGGFADFYWSSSESNASNAWNVSFGSGSAGSRSKSLTYGVRAVRAF
jgi:hypothetical protein